MPPKKDKKSKKKKKEPEPEPEPQIPLSDESLEEQEMDMVMDINEEFFAKANKAIQTCMEHSRVYEATKMKKFLDIIYRLHFKYVEEVKLNLQLQPQIVMAEKKLRTALELSANSEEAMERLQDKLADAWREADASQLREQVVQDKLQEVMIKCEGFERKESSKQGDNMEFGPLSKYKNIILRERDRINGEVIELEKRLHMQRFYSESLEYINKNQEDSITKLSTRLRVLDMEKTTAEVKNRSLTNSLDDQRDLNAKTTAKMEQLGREVTETQNKLTKKSTAYDRQRLVLEKFKNDNVFAMRQIGKNEAELASMRKEAKENDELIKALRLEDKVKENLINMMNIKYKKALQDVSAVSSKLYKLNRNNHALNSDIVRLKNQVNSLDKDVQTAVYKYDDMRRVKDNVTRERDTLRSDITKLNNLIGDLKHTIMMHSITIDTLRMDINKLNVKLDEAKINISKSEKERDEMARETETLHERIEYYQEQVKLKTEQVVDLTEKLQTKHYHLINVKKQMEEAHSEKMMLRRALEMCSIDRDEMRSVQAKTDFELTQFILEISVNQKKINALNMKIEHLENDKKDLQSELKNTENVLANVRRELKETKMKNESQLKTIVEDERRFLKMSNELDETRKEKNLVGLQMVRRNDEIIILKEKVATMQTALDQGQTQYNQRAEDVRLLKTEIANLLTERECHLRAIKSTADMRREIIRLHRSLNQERIKLRALTEDLKTPTGVHRWRILKGEDPDKLELLVKMQMLQKRMLKQEIQKTNLLQELEEQKRVCASLKRILENVPAGNAKQELVNQQRINRAQTRKIKVLKAELTIETIELNAHKCVVKEYSDLLKKTQSKKPCADVEKKKVEIVESKEELPNYEGMMELFQDCVFEPSVDSNILCDKSLSSTQPEI